jgi:hypothetical protein
VTSHRLLLDEPLLTYQPALVRRIGLAEAAIVQQLQFWMKHATMVHEGHPWVYKTYADWAHEIGLSTKAIRGATDRLRKSGLVVAIQSPLDARDRTLWWRIDYSKLDDDEQGSPSAPEGSLTAATGSSRARVPSGPSDPQVSENSTENTTETTARDARPDVGQASSSTVSDLFDYWRDTCNHPQSRPTRDRLAKIQARLREGYTPTQIRTAIDGAKRHPFVNDAGKVYDEIDLICRNGAKVEDFIERARRPLAPAVNGHEPTAANGFKGRDGKTDQGALMRALLRRGGELP